MSSFENLRIVDNFYQTSLFFPMPTVVISTLCEDGSTNLWRLIRLQIRRPKLQNLQCMLTAF